jgi:broad specificity phosphatase PhoE
MESPMTEIYLVRHPESAQNTDRSIVGGRSNETPITKRGEQQARQFAKAFLAHYPAPDAFYTSPAVRTKTLLDMYNEVSGQQNGYFIDPDLHELSQGLSEGLQRDAVYTPEVLAAIAEYLHDFALPGGESLNDVSGRMEAWLGRVEQRHPNGVVLASTHGIAIRALVGKQLGWSHAETTTNPVHDVDNVSLTRLTVDNGKISVDFWGKNIIEPIENPSE